MGFWRHLLARSVQLVYRQPQICSPCITFSIRFLPGSEAAMEAAGSLAPTFPKVFSGHMVPRLKEELQSGRAGKGVVTGFGVKPFPLGVLPDSGAVLGGVGQWLSLGDSQCRHCVLAQGRLWLVW